MTQSLLIATATDMLGSRPLASPGEVADWHASLWKQLEDTGLSLVGVPEHAGGPGGSIDDIMTVVRLVGRFSAHVPVADTAMLAAWVLAEAGLTVPSGQLAAFLPTEPTFTLSGPEGQRSITGTAWRVPYASSATRVVVSALDSVGGLWVVSLPVGALEVRPGANLAGEPRDELSCDGLAVPDGDLTTVSRDVLEELALRGALARSAAMVGAAERALELTLRYSRERVQFGKPLGKFQAIQGLVAEQSGEVAAAAAALETAIEAVRDGDNMEIAVAAAKVRIGSAAGRVSAIAHQVHGALGMTDEHPLHLATLSIWSWRDEYGSEADWAVRLGRLALAAGGSGLWPMLVALPAPPIDPETTTDDAEGDR